MISRYVEGGVRNIGLNIGWVMGPVVCFLWVNLRKDTGRQIYIRLAYDKRKLFNRRLDYENCSWTDNHKRQLFDYSSQYVLMTKEEHQNMKDSIGKGELPCEA